MKRFALLARDSAQLLIERRPAERERLRDQKRAWTESLKLSRAYGRRAGDEADAGSIPPATK